MNIKEKYYKKFKLLIDKLNLTQKSIEEIEKNYFLPVINYLIENGVILKDKNIVLYKKDSILGLKINDFLIKIISNNVLDKEKKTIILPLSIDEGEELLTKIIEKDSDIRDIVDYIFIRLGEKEKAQIYKNLNNIDDSIKYYILRNYPLLSRINGILDDIIMKILEKMTNNEIVTLMLMMNIEDRRKILRNVSKGRKKILLDELSYIHYFKKSERLKVKNKFYKLLKEFIEENNRKRAARVL